MKYVLVFILFPVGCFCQHKNDIWIFGDSAGINFHNPLNPTTFKINVKSRGTSSTVCNSNGDLLFYFAYDTQGMFSNPEKNGQVYNRFGNIMPNGDSIISELWYRESQIIPFAQDSNKFYLFTISVVGVYGLYYSVIDMTLDSSKGEVTQKNIALLSLPANDGLMSIKHGNGRDWWLIFREFDGTPDNKFYKYLITPSGIIGPYMQNIGTVTNTNTLTYNFNSEGNKLAVVQYEGLCEIFDFDRCTGNLSNHTLIRGNATVAPSPAFWSCEFSPNNNFLYVSTSGDTSYLIQIDLLSATPWLNADTLWNESSVKWAGGALLRAPDDKIYLTCAWNDNVNWNFPYPDTVFNQINSNLSVINQPDSPGVACNFTPYSFYLGGARTYWGLPNNPNYDLPKLAGSICDSLQFTGMLGPLTLKRGNATLLTTYVSEWKKLFVNAKNINGRNCTLNIFDVSGREVYSSSKKTQPPYFTQDIDVSNLSSGLYLVSLFTEKEILSTKFIKD